MSFKGKECTKCLLLGPIPVAALVPTNVGRGSTPMNSTKRGKNTQLCDRRRVNNAGPITVIAAIPFCRKTNWQQYQ